MKKKFRLLASRLCVGLVLIAAASSVFAASAGAAASSASGGPAGATANVVTRCGSGTPQQFAVDFTNIQPASGLSSQYVAVKIWTQNVNDRTDWRQGAWKVIRAPQQELRVTEQRAAGSYYVLMESLVWTGNNWEGKSYKWLPADGSSFVCQVHSQDDLRRLEEQHGSDILYYWYLTHGGLNSLVI